MRDVLSLVQDAQGLVAIIHRASGQAIGSTRYTNVDTRNRRLEIGWTWVIASFQRTAVNTEAKLLLLTHAFEVLGNALLRLGAVEEGTFRKHLITASGQVRDTVYFSIIDTVWPAIKARLSC